MSAITTHVLDTSRGTPGTDIPVRLEALDDAGWMELSRGFTDSDGRARLLEEASAGEYKLTFSFGGSAFYPEISIHFNVRDARDHHIPLLLSAFGYSTYRGS